MGSHMRYGGPRRLTRFLDFTMNNSPYAGARTLDLHEWYANVTRNVTSRELPPARSIRDWAVHVAAREFAAIAAGLHCDAFEYDVVNDGSQLQEAKEGTNAHAQKVAELEKKVAGLRKVGDGSQGKAAAGG
eukprot:gene13046-43482_t